MCGIVGIISKDSLVAEKILQGLQSLEYRGYDSAGISVYNGSKIERIRSIGKISKLKELWDLEKIDGLIGIGHSRWATHGGITIKNTHPHSNGKITLVHNGIIENYKEIKEELLKKDIVFESETDTEVLVHLLSGIFKETNSELESIFQLVKKIKGAFSLGIIFSSDTSKIYALRQGSPLVIGKNENESYLASDVLAISSWADESIYMDDCEICILEAKNTSFFNFNGEKLTKHFSKISVKENCVQKGQYKHFMLKEIFEQPTVLRSILNTYASRELKQVNVPDIDWNNVSSIKVIGCGTSFYAAMVSRYWFERIAKVKLETELAHEFRYMSPVVDKNELVIFISQSGETIETLFCAKMLKDSNSLALTNVVHSSIARECKKIMNLNASLEIGVASTKAFTASLMCLALLALDCAIKKNKISKEEFNEYLDELFCIPSFFEEILSKEHLYKDIASWISKSQSVLFMGRNVCYPIALEAALKLKEISYIHSSGYACGELKHGPIALIDENIPVIVLAPYDEKIASSIQEVLARRGLVIAFSNEPSKLNVHTMIEMPNGSFLTNPFLYALPVQLLSYHVGLARGTDIDQPRNLAKSVTVE